MNAAVFLDRDNTLIVNDGDLGDPDEVVLRNGVVPGLRALRKAGYRLVVVTNQGGVARGVYGEEQVDAVHQRIAELVSGSDQGDDVGDHLIDRFYYCPYHPEGSVERYRREHPWRKPAPGMLLQAASDLGVDLQRSWMIGDQVRDIQAGRAAGCRTVLLSDVEQDDAEADPDACVSDFESAVAAVLEGLEDDRRSAQQQSAKAAPLKSAPARPASTSSSRTSSSSSSSSGSSDVQALQRAMHDLCEELQSARQRSTEFTLLRMGAGMVQLGVLLCALLGLLQLNAGDPWVFVRWMMGAVLLQCFAIFLLVADQR